MSWFRTFFVTCLLGVLIGCSANSKQGNVTKEPETAPTLNAVFNSAAEESQAQNDNLEEDALAFEPLAVTPETLGVKPTLTPLPTLTPVPTVAMRSVMVYDDTLNPNWSLTDSWEATYEVADSSFVHEGELALAYTPQVPYAKLVFSVRKDSSEVYLRDDVLAVRFWVYSGEDYIATDDLAVSIIGSNAFPYWVANDDSVTVQDNHPVFPETRLYYLNVDKDIPPNTWFQIEVWLNDLIYDPQYKYVTGIVVTNDEDFLRTISVDDVELVLREQ